MSVLLEVNGISVSFDGFKAINNLSFSISNRELRAIIGPNGAGKTTFMDIVTGKTKPDAGTVLWGEKNLSLLRMNEAQIVEVGISRKFQKPTLIETQTVFQNLLLSLKKLRNPLSTLFYKLSIADEKEINENSKNQGDKDELYQSAVDIIKSEGKASTSFLQRKLQIGYNRAARIIDMMEADGVVSKANHVGKRDVL